MYAYFATENNDQWPMPLLFCFEATDSKLELLEKISDSIPKECLPNFVSLNYCINFKAYSYDDGDHNPFENNNGFFISDLSPEKIGFLIEEPIENKEVKVYSGGTICFVANLYAAEYFSETYDVDCIISELEGFTENKLFYLAVPSNNPLEFAWEILELSKQDGKWVVVNVDNVDEWDDYDILVSYPDLVKLGE